MNTPAVLFIVGVGRSGTSLLQSMFAAHPAVSFMPETSFLRRYVATAALTRKYMVGGERAVVEMLAADAVFGRTGRDVPAMVRQALERAEPLDVAVYHQMIQSRCKTGASWVGDKDPRLIEALPVIASMFQGATIVNIIRDPRDVLLSKKKAAWSCKGHVWKHIFANRVQLKLGRRLGRQLFGANYHEIQYEELIRFPEAILCGLCNNIGLPFSGEMLKFDKAAKELTSKNEYSWKKETLGPLLTNNKEKWVDGLDDREIVLTELSCREAFSVGSYRFECRQHSLSWRDRLWVFAGLLVISLADCPYRLFRNYRISRACKRLK